MTSTTLAGRLLDDVVHRAALTGMLSWSGGTKDSGVNSARIFYSAGRPSRLRLVNQTGDSVGAEMTSAPDHAAKDGCVSIHSITALTFVRMSRRRAHREWSAVEQSASVRQGRFADATLSTFPPASKDDMAGLIPFSFQGWK